MINTFEEKNKELAELAKLMTPARIRAIRNSYGLTQVKFSNLCGIAYNTYRNWEIGHRSPCTPAVSLLIIAEQNPKSFLSNIEEYKRNYKMSYRN